MPTRANFSPSSQPRTFTKRFMKYLCDSRNGNYEAVLVVMKRDKSHTMSDQMHTNFKVLYFINIIKKEKKKKP